MYICIKFSPEDLNPSPYPLHPISTYIYEVTIAPKMCGDSNEVC